MKYNYIARTVVSVALSLCFVGAAAQTAPSGGLQKAAPTVKVTANESQGIVLRSRAEIPHRTLPRFEMPQTKTGIPSVFSVAPRKAEGGVDGTYIYGSLEWSDNWSSDDDDYYAPYGIYRLPINGGDGVRVVRRNESLHANGGGVLKNGKYYFIICYNSLWGTKFPYLSVADTENSWQPVGEETAVPSGAYATDMTYDAVTDKTYGCFHTSDAPVDYFFGTLDLETVDVANIAALTRPLVAVAADNSGRVFGIDDKGALSEINKETGALTLIGETGVTSDYQGSACFDPATNKLYWTVTVDAPAGNQAYSYLYEVNTNDASLHLVCHPALNEQFTGICIFPPKAEATAPDAVKNLAVTAEENALAGKVTFTMPAETYDGSALQGELTYTVKLNGEQLAQNKAQAGTDVEVPFSLKRSMLCTFEVTASNEAGESPVAKAEKWIGPDVPKAVGSLTARRNAANTGFDLTWTVDTKGEHGMTIAPDDIRFDVLRYPGEVKVATDLAGTTVTDIFDVPEEYSVYYYTVIPKIGNSEGAPAISNAVSTGSIIPPFFEGFDNKFGYDVFTIINNNSEPTWDYDNSGDNPFVFVKYDVIAPMDDWFITPPVRLEADREYTFSFKASGKGGMWTEKVEARFGDAPRVSSLSTQLVPVTELPEAEYVTLQGKVTPSASGDYYFAIHGLSAVNNFNLNVDDISIEPGASLYGPAAPGLVCSPDMTGALAVTLTVTAPELTLEGKPLESIEKIEVYREDNLVHTFDNPRPGQTLTCTDNKPEQGLNTYSAKAYNATGAGAVATVTAQAGFDTPAPPSDITLRETSPGTVTLTWTAPSIGQHGGPIRPESLRYSIVRETDEEVLASGIKDLTFTDTPVTGDNQQNVSYFILSQTDEGYGVGASSGSIPVGKAYDLPFSESFAGASINYATWLIRRPAESKALWGIAENTTNPSVSPYDRDGGMAAFYPAAAGEEATIISGKISLENTVNPTLDFYYYYNPGNDCLSVDIETPGGTVKRAFSVDFASLSGTAQWRKASVSLAGFKSEGYVRIGFAGRSGNGASCIAVDAITIADKVDYDLAVGGLTVAARPAAGQPTPVTATVVNRGQQPAEGYTVSILANGELRQTTPGFRLEPGASMPFIYAFTPSKGDPSDITWEARIDYSADENPANNTGTAMSFAQNTRLPAVADLAADTSSGVKLTWSEPQSEVRETAVDGAEGYANYTIDDMGEWTLIDVDGSTTYSFSQANGEVYDYPNVGMPMAFQVLDPTAIGMPDSDLAGIMPRTGSKMFICFDSTDGRNDDWLISPVLTGESQVISFFAHSVPSDYGLESFELYYSTKGTSLDDFVRIATVDGSAVPVAWTEYATRLPEGTKHFAIRCVSDDCFALIIDDITFTKADAPMQALNINGYNVYRDGALLTEAPVKATSYADDSYDGQRHSYNVTAVYAEGESAGSNTVTVDLSGLENVTAAEEVGITVDRTVISVSAADAVDVTVTAADGKTVFAGEGHASYRVDVTPGIYIVKAGNIVSKVIAH